MLNLLCFKSLLKTLRCFQHTPTQMFSFYSSLMTLLSQVRLLLNSSCCVPDVAVTCFHLEDCVLPCAFQPGGNETVAWFRQDALLYRFDRNGSKESLRLQQLAPRASITPQQISEGNASLVLRRAVTKDRGIYRCHVQTSAGEHKAKVILKVIGEFTPRRRTSRYQLMTLFNQESQRNIENTFQGWRSVDLKRRLGQVNPIG
uniref:Ig-like domain-containing protein n=1 Tax=Fundulus heteroclitus TaxID=8078 RepID=A0A3Q2PCI9_FUNHE